MAFLSFDEIIAKDDLKTEVVPVPEWGGEVMIRTLSAAERDDFEKTLSKTRNGKVERNLENFRARLAALVMIDPDTGVLLVKNEKQARMLGQKSVAALERIVNAATRLNGMSEDDVEEMTKGFDEESDESESSTSGLHSLSE